MNLKFMEGLLVQCKRLSVHFQGISRDSRVRHKANTRLIALTMKLTTVIILVGALHISAASLGQKVTFSGTNVPLSTVFNAITEQTGYGVVMSHATLESAKPVTMDLKEATLDEVLTKCFSYQTWKLGYTITGHTISITTAESLMIEVPALTTPSDVVGIVRSEDGNPLAGATIEIKQLNKKGLTNEKGEFFLKGVPKGKYQVEITYIGYDKYLTNIVVDDHEIRLSADLKQSTNNLDQVQIIAYGTTTQRLSTGNVTTVKGEDIEKQPVNNPLLALEGRVPGLFITQNSGLPGSSVAVQLQGKNSISNGSSPLYVIDGVPYASGLLTTTTGGTSGLVIGNPFNFINPSDIESIDVLKDADATAIYGSRAANGAILITTKKGKEGETKVDINLQQGHGKVTRMLDLMNTKQYLQMRHEALKNDGIVGPSITDYDINGLWDTTRYTNWQKELIGGTSNYTNLSGSISGGTTSTQYLVGGTYHRETTVFPGNFSDQKGSIHFNLNSISTNQKLRVQLSCNYLVDNNQLPAGDLTNIAIILPPDAPTLYNPDGTLNWKSNSGGNSSWNNPISYTLNTYQNKANNLLSNLILSYKLLPGLDIKSSFGYTNLQTNEIQIAPLISISPEVRSLVQRSAYYTYSNINSWIIEPQVTFKKIFGKGKLDVLAGTTILHTSSNGQDLSGTGYNSDAVLTDIHSAVSVSINSSINSIYRYNALFGRINYNWQDKYILDLSARRDGSSRFGPQNQFHNFASIGAAWIFSQEKFIKDNMSFLGFGKLRGSYGSTASDQIGDYKFMNLYTPITSQVAYQAATGLTISGLPNPYLQWEETRKLQFGLDLGFLNDKVLFSSNYVFNRSSNELLSYALPMITGFSNIIENLPATVQNTEWEFVLNSTRIKKKNFTWRCSLNLTIPQNKLVAFPNISTSTYASTLIVGQPITILEKYHFLGVNSSTGVYAVSDNHGNQTSSPNPVTDKISLVNTLPKYYGGFQNYFQYKYFSLDVFINFVKQIGNNYLFGQYAGAEGINQPVSVLGRWQKPGDVKYIQQYNSNYSLYGAYSNVAGIPGSDAAYSDASYIRLKNLSLSYQLPMQWRLKNKLQECRVYIQGQNLLTITRFKGLDPENKSTTALPPLRIITVGLEVCF